MVYTLPEYFGADVPGGTSFLFHGSALTGKREAGFETLSRGFEDGGAALVVCFENSPKDAVASLVEKSTASESDIKQCVGILNASAENTDLDELRTEEVDSPADLTGVGIGMSKLLSDLDERCEGVRVLYDSISAPLMYRDTETVYSFLQSTVGGCSEKGALSVAVLDTGVPDEYETKRFFGLFDGTVEFRSAEGTVEYRPQNVPGVSRGWKTVSEVEAGPPSPAKADLEFNGDGSTEDRQEHRTVADALPDTIESLHSLAESVLGSRQTVTVFNHSDGDMEKIRSYFDTFGVGVSTSETEEGPADFAVLHQGKEFLAAAPLGALSTAIDVEEVDLGEDVPEDHFGQLLLAHIDQSAFAAREVWRRFLIRMSRHIELRALRSGNGTFHAGFQELSRIYDDHGTRGVYTEIADSGIDVHIYGTPDIDEVSGFDDSFTVHTDEENEIATTWFLVYTDGADRSATLVAEEKEDGRYHGFWSFDESVAKKATEYIESTYPESDKRAKGD